MEAKITAVVAVVLQSQNPATLTFLLLGSWRLDQIHDWRQTVSFLQDALHEPSDKPMFKVWYKNTGGWILNARLGRTRPNTQQCVWGLAQNPRVEFKQEPARAIGWGRSPVSYALLRVVSIHGLFVCVLFSTKCDGCFPGRALGLTGEGAGPPGEPAGSRGRHPGRRRRRDRRHAGVRHQERIQVMIPPATKTAKTQERVRRISLVAFVAENGN